jgi:hypothetical protein
MPFFSAEEPLMEKFQHEHYMHEKYLNSPETTKLCQIVASAGFSQRKAPPAAYSNAKIQTSGVILSRGSGSRVNRYLFGHGTDSGC